jgi:hypothetical protein
MLKQAIACLLLVAGVACSLPVDAARCTGDTIATGGFETLADVRIRGMVGGLEHGVVEARDGDAVLASTGLSGGTFAIDLPPLATELMIELRVRGHADRGQDFVELASHLGTIAQLHDERDPDGLTRVARVPTLGVSSESTARWSLVREQLAAGQAVAHECHLARLAAEVDRDELLRRAAVIQILIADGGSIAAKTRGKNAGGTTLEIISDPQRLEDTVSAIEQSEPGRLASLVEVLAEPFCGNFARDASIVLQQRLTGQWMNMVSGEVQRPVDPGTGRHVNSGGADSYLLDCDTDMAAVELAGERYSTGFPTRTVDGVLRQVQARIYLNSKRLTRVSADETGIVLADYSDSLQVFPFDPSLASERMAGEGRRVLIRKPEAELFDADTVPGEYLLATSGRPDVEANRVELLAGGVGTDLDSGLPLDWAVDDSGRLALQFRNAESAPLRSALITPIRDDTAHVSDTITLVDSAQNGEVATASLLLKKQASTLWQDDASVPGFYLQAAGRVLGGEFYWELREDRTAPAYSVLDDSTVLDFTYAWSRPAAGEVVLRRCRDDGLEKMITDREPAPGECTDEYRRRSWQLYSVSESCVYLREEQITWFGVDPATAAPNGYRFARGYFYSRPAERPLPPQGTVPPTGC